MGLETTETESAGGLIEGNRDRRDFLFGATGALTAAFVGAGLAGCGGELDDGTATTEGALTNLTYTANFNVARSNVAALASNLAAIPLWMPIITHVTPGVNGGVGVGGTLDWTGTVGGMPTSGHVVVLTWNSPSLFKWRDTTNGQNVDAQVALTATSSTKTKAVLTITLPVPPDQMTLGLINAGVAQGIQNLHTLLGG